MSLHTLMYQSRARIPNDPIAHNDILATCDRRNRTQNITGFLHREGDWFLQYLEGPAAALDEAMVRISRDPRHAEIQVLLRGETELRRFPDWQMGFVASGDLGLAELLDTDGGTLNLRTQDPFDLVVFLAHNADMLRPRAAA